MRVIRFHPVVIALFIALATAAASIAQSTPPFLGTWKVDTAKSDVTTMRLSFARTPSGDITMTMQGTSYDFRIDGKPYPSPFSSVATWTETGPRSWRTLYRMNNIDNNIDNYALSADGNTLTMKTEFLVPTRTEQTMTFTRAGSGQGLLGNWQAKTLQTPADQTMTFTAADGGRIRLRMLPIDGTAVMPTDGTDTAVTGPASSIPPGMTMGFKVTGARTFDLSLKDKGTVVFMQHGTVSADGRTMTIQSVNGPTGATQDRSTIVYEKQ